MYYISTATNAHATTTQETSRMKPLIPLLLLTAVLILTGAAAAEENDHIHPPEYGVILTGDTVIDTIAPDKKTAEAFIRSSVYDTVIDCLIADSSPSGL